MSPAEARSRLRAMHRPGTDDLATAVAMVRAMTADDVAGLLGVVAGLDESDDVLGIAIWCAIIAGSGLRGHEATPRFLDVVAAAEREAAGA